MVDRDLVHAGRNGRILLRLGRRRGFDLTHQGRETPAETLLLLLGIVDHSDQAARAFSR